MKEYLKSKLNTLTEICIPTGAGKGYLMMIDLLNRIVSTRKNLFVVSTHRLIVLAIN